MSLAQAIHMYTDWAAFTNKAEAWVGRLEAGMAGDFVILPPGTACTLATQATRSDHAHTHWFPYLGALGLVGASTTPVDDTSEAVLRSLRTSLLAVSPHQIEVWIAGCERRKW